MVNKPKPSLLKVIKQCGVLATVTSLLFLGHGVTKSECGGFVHIKMSDSVNELLMDKRNCQVPTIADDPVKPLALDHTNDSTKEDKSQVD
ncbi:hypothetical protein [Anabaena sp. CCY 0017]|uniref:hypothetical protein n=1 Tax=Anabaena sp. CCY 0017 TaxID=3103866 RepID=UPI0039C6C4FF